MSRRIFFISSITRTRDSFANATYNDYKTGMPVFFSIRTERITKCTKEAMKGHSIYISWETESEINTSYFELQRSENAKNFYSIAIIKARGVTKSRTRYVMMDPRHSFLNDTIYYRLQIVSLQATACFTDIIILNLKSVTTPSVHDLTYTSNKQ